MQQALDRLLEMKRGTTIVIAHRLSTIRYTREANMCVLLCCVCVCGVPVICSALFFAFPEAGSCSLSLVLCDCVRALFFGCFFGGDGTPFTLGACSCITVSEEKRKEPASSMADSVDRRGKPGAESIEGPVCVRLLSMLFKDACPMQRLISSPPLRVPLLFPCSRVFASDLSRNADKICVVEGGKIVETGKHDDLIGIEGGKYLQLVRLQLGGVMDGCVT